MTTYTITQDQLDLLTGVLERAGTTDDSEYKWDTHSKAKKMLRDLQPNTQEHRADIAFGGPKAREQMLNQLVHPAPQQKPLTDDQIDKLQAKFSLHNTQERSAYGDAYLQTCNDKYGARKFARAIEAAHNIGVKP